MNKQSQEENRGNLWNQAIRHVEAKLSRVNHEGEAKRLRAAIGSFKAHRDAGFEWPGKKKTGMEHTPIPA